MGKIPALPQTAAETGMKFVSPFWLGFVPRQQMLTNLTGPAPGPYVEYKSLCKFKCDTSPQTDGCFWPTIAFNSIRINLCPVRGDAASLFDLILRATRGQGE